MEGDVATSYRSVRLRLSELLTSVTADEPAAWKRPVAACPGWTVRDVLAHLVGNLEDGRDGLLSGPPGPALTEAQVRRHRDDDPAELLAAWSLMAEPAEQSLAGSGRWPVFLDALSHEHDVRSALNRPGARDDADVQLAARLLAGRWGTEPGRGFTLVLDDVDPIALLDGNEPITLRTTSYTWLRLRMGRRTTDEVFNLEWSTDPTPLLDRLFVFGPTQDALNE